MPSLEEQSPRNATEAVGALDRFWPVLDEWWARFREPMSPAPGSALALDDLAWRRAPVSSIAQARMGVALDDLQAIRVLCQAGSFHAAAVPTLARSALLAASEAMWMLAPDEARLRQRRGVEAALEGDRQHLLYLGAQKNAPGALMKEIVLVRAQLLLRQRGATFAAAALGAPGPTDNTGIIRWSATHMQQHNLAWRDQAVALWRAASGSAHGHQFGVMAHSEPRPAVREPSGILAEHRAGGGPLITWQCT